ncbi:NADPH-dependent oxidoreductase [Actinomyces sp. B33]|uniref:NADPH-dependent oxidoreductase n=1 Tax=Actinomyces sp. B33 TaxID=2942131 RepID=UPI0023411D58|nr:NADPH-dependent oxidoreductase [Actinomyces sp. B33]MDC4233951.1 NADPH-dependent oxidoreductase [Actinomyces sp. B33]
MSPLTHRQTAPVENDTIRAQMGHRTIRAFTDDPLGDDVLTTLYEVARHTASSSFLQQTTILRVTDPAIREELHLASGQPYVGGTRGELLVFIADQYRNSRIRAEGGVDNEPLERTNLLLTALHDTLLSAQNVVVAAESMGLGTCYLGSILADPRRVIAALDLPPLTFPVVGLLVGRPAQDPQYKPRLPLSVITGENTYPRLDSYSEALVDYDALVTEYYDLRDAARRVESFTTLVRTSIGRGGAHVSPILDVLHEQGFALR